jgi:hypothetical protein
VIRAVLGVVILLSLTGCASDQALQAKRLESVPALTLVRNPTPDIQRHSEGTIVGGGLLLGGFGMEAVAGAAGTELSERCKLPDFGMLVVGEFAAKAPQQIPTWPRMDVKQSPVEPPYSAKDSYVISIQPVVVWLYSFGASKGLNTGVMATFVAPNGEVLWRRQAFYSQKQAHRERELGELEANDCKLLKEEMQHAASFIADDFVADLKRQQ